ncbi:MAG TPA: YciI family protein [Kofleriaceae bacterium]
MQYLLLIYDNENVWNDMSKEESAKAFGEYMQFTTDIKKSGHFVAGDALQPVSTATTVRIRNGKSQVTDGPFAETKEQLGGYYLIEAKDLDEARMIAEKIPSVRYGSIEIRPVQNFKPPG